MTKPDWCPQRVWDEAHAVNMDQLWAVVPDDPDDTKLYQDTASIARAILAAEQREREACAWVAEQEIYSQPDDDYQLGRTESAMLIRSAIRNRSQDQ